MRSAGEYITGISFHVYVVYDSEPSAIARSVAVNSL